MLDVIVLGRGPVAAAIAVMLSESQLDWHVVGMPHANSEQRSNHADTERALALSYGSRLILERLGIWDTLPVTPLSAIHVSQRGGFGRTLLQAQDLKVPALGYVVAYDALLDTLKRRLNASATVNGNVKNIEWADNAVTVHLEHQGSDNTLQARLLIVADGGERMLAAGQTKRQQIGAVATRDYGTSAVSTNIVTDKPHGNIAWERFTHAGPLALLPFNNPDDKTGNARYSLVWTETGERTSFLCNCSESQFLEELQSTFGQRAGHFISASPRTAFPLSLAWLKHIDQPRTVAVGNASQTLHPVAGQGLNLGLRDAAVLLDILTGVSHDGIGTPDMLAAYAKARRLDRRSIIHITDALARIFSLPFLSPARSAGLALFDLLPPLRSRLAEAMMFGIR